MDQLLTVEQAALRLRVHPRTVRRHLKDGTLRGVKRGNFWRVPESAVRDPSKAQVSPLVRAVALIEARDAAAGPVAIREDGSALSDLRGLREGRAT